MRGQPASYTPPDATQPVGGFQGRSVITVVPIKTRASICRTVGPTRLVRFALTTITAILCLLLWHADLAGAQAAGTAPAASTSGAAAQASADSDEDDDAVLDPAEPDFVVVNLPTTARAPVFKGNFRLTHRFAGNLMNGSFTQQAGNLFGIDQGAIIGFEFRMALARGLQAAAYRSSFDKTIQFHGKYDVVRQRSAPVAISALVSIEGTNNFQEKYAPAVGVVISRMIASRIALYATPIWVDNTAASLAALTHDHSGAAAEDVHDDHVHRSTTFLGLGTRLRVSSTVYLVGEMAPRLDGYAPDKIEYGFGIEKRVGGHVFSLTFTNSFGTTYAQLARGGAADTLFLGFNLGRKYF